MIGSAEKNLRAAIVIGHLGYGGAERQLTELALRLEGRGVIPHVFCLGGTDQPFGPLLRAHGVPVTHIARRGGFDLTRAFRLAARLRSGKFEIVHSFLIDTNPYAFFAARFTRSPAFLASNRNADFPRGPFRAFLDAAVFRRASKIVVNSEAVRKFTAQRFHVQRDHFTVIYNGVDLERFCPRSGTRSGRLTIGTVGNLSSKKNPELFASVCDLVRNRFADIRCLHLGEGPLRDTLASRNRGLIEFLGTRDAVESFLAELDVFLLTSDREGCPNVLLEAMACGIPVVTTDAGGAPEVVRDGDTGFLAPRGDAFALADRVCRLLGDAPLQLRMGASGRAEAERRFGLGRMVGEMAALYRRTAGIAATREAA